MPNQGRNLAVLVASQAIFTTGSSLVVATAALVGHRLAADPRLATLPTGLGFLAAMLITYPASLVMQTRGRRFGFQAGFLSGAVGAILATISILRPNFPLFCVALLLVGVNRGIAPYYRFAAVEAVSEGRRARAIACVLVGGLVAAFLGPGLARWTETLIAQPFAGSFSALIGVQLLGLITLAGLDLPRVEAVEAASSGRPLARVAAQPRYLVAAFGAVVSYATMNALMTATPLAMAERGFAFGPTASVIQWHLAGMFAPALVSGRLVERFGPRRMMVLGAAGIGVAAAGNLAGTTFLHFALSLGALGVGWNFLFVAATALITETYEPAEQARAQGFNDLLVLGAMTVSATTAGWLYESAGWWRMNAAVLPLVGLVILAVALLGSGGEDLAPAKPTGGREALRRGSTPS